MNCSFTWLIQNHMLGCAAPRCAHIIHWLASVFPSACSWTKQVIYFCEGHINELVSIGAGCGLRTTGCHRDSNYSVTSQQCIEMEIVQASFSIINNRAVFVMKRLCEHMWALSFHHSTQSTILSPKMACYIILCSGEWLLFCRIIPNRGCLWGLFVSRDSNCPQDW